MTIPEIKLNNGVFIPAIGSGPAAIGYSSIQNKNTNYLLRKVYKKIFKTPIQKLKYVSSVAHSFDIGFNLLDFSSSYGDFSSIRKAINKSSIEREDLFITSRASNCDQFNNTIKESLLKTLENLKTDYVDLFMFHWPVTGHYIETWKQIEELYEAGYCRSIGVANCNIHHLKEIKKNCKVIPVINQIEVHPLFSQKNLISYCKDNQITVQAYSPIARNDDRLVRLPLLKSISEKYEKSVVQVILRWHIQNGVIPIIRSLNKKRQLENITIFDFELTEEEMKLIDSIDINARIRFDPDNCDFTIL